MSWRPRGPEKMRRRRRPAARLASAAVMGPAARMDAPALREYRASVDTCWPLLHFFDAGEAGMRSIRPIALPIAGMLLAALFCNCAHGEVRVQGDVRDVRVEVRDATVAEILAALAERFALRYRGSPGNGGITATFEGPLRRVVTHVLAGHNYVIAARGGGLEVIVLGAGSAAAVPAPMFAPPTVPAKVNRRRDD
jgi:hypothetical protein